jgi:hypothetical protein
MNASKAVTLIGIRSLVEGEAERLDTGHVVLRG